MRESIIFAIDVMQAVVFLYFVCVNSMYTLFTLVAIKDIRGHLFTTTKLEMENIFAGVLYKPLTIIVPAFNEAETVLTTLRSLLNLHYPEFEIVVVNDGSTDNTLEKLIAEFHLVRVEK